MLKNLLLTALRSLKKKPTFTFINIFGLAIGMATCLTILLYVDHETSFDDFQKDDVYRIALNRVYPDREVDFAVIPHSIGPQMVLDFPEVKNQTRLFKPNNTTSFQYGDKTIEEENLVFGDSTILNVMSIEIVNGDPKTALRESNSIVISESAAKRYFSDEDPIGKILDTPNGIFKVSAIAKDYATNSHFLFDAIIPLHSIPFFNRANWAGFSVINYIKLEEGASPKSVVDKMPAFIKQYAEGEIQQRNGISYDEYISAGNGYNYTLQPIKDIYLTSDLNGEIKPNGNIAYVYIFSIAAIFILIIACINFMNLATARSVERAKEVGIRKVMGSGKRQLVAQFLTESILTAFIAGGLALLITFLVQSTFAEISGKNLSLISFLSFENIVLLTVSVTIIGVLAGLYPAFFISSYAPISILRGSMKTSGKGVMLRNVLVVFQFTFSIALISATLIVYSQMQFLQNKPLGFEEDQVLIVENGFAINNNPNTPNWERFETFETELLNIQDVTMAGYSSALPGDILQGFIVKVPGSGEKESLVTRMIAVDDSFSETMGMEIIEGRDFSKDFNDSLSMVVNEATVEKLNLTNPVGQKIIYLEDSAQTQFTIVGVMKNFHFESLHNAVEPMVITKLGTQGFVNKYAVKISSKNIQNTLLSIESKWNEFAPKSPFRYYFLDSNLAQFYESERASGKLFTAFTFLAGIVACIGLLGLSAFIINQKTKEIGVRKVLGGSVLSIIFLLSKDILKLIGLATLIAIPASYYWGASWLENFAYAVPINWLIFVLSGVGALIIALLTVSFQSTKAALANPVESLKDE